MRDGIDHESLHLRVARAQRGVVPLHHAFHLRALFEKAQGHGAGLVQIEVNSHASFSGLGHQQPEIVQSFFVTFTQPGVPRKRREFVKDRLKPDTGDPAIGEPIEVTFGVRPGLSFEQRIPIKSEIRVTIAQGFFGDCGG